MLDEQDRPVAGATLYLVAPRDLEREGLSSAICESDRRGLFRFAENALELGGRSAESATSIDLGVVANGFLRRFVPDVLRDPSRSSAEGLRVVLSRGSTLFGRVVDADGTRCSRPRAARLDERRRDRSRESEPGAPARGGALFWAIPRPPTSSAAHEPTISAAWSSAGYLPRRWRCERSIRAGRWKVRAPFERARGEVLWTAARRLGVRLSVFDATSGRALDRASATFRFECSFANGEVRDFGQWVGRGAGVVSFVLDPELLPGLEERTITAVTFYGTAASGRRRDVVDRRADRGSVGEP